MRKFFLTLFSVTIILVAFYFFWLVPKYTIPILAYHSIGYRDDNPFVSVENFAKQLRYIKEKGYDVITLDELAEGIKNKKIFKRNKVVITFDDGFKDNFQSAYPVLKKFSFPATIFLITDYIGKEKEFLNWDEVMAMSKNKISFGAHTKTHFYLGPGKDDEVVREEIVGSKKAIEKEAGLTVNNFSYPTGGFNERVKEIVKEAGFKSACTTNRGFAKLNSDVYELKRIKVTDSDMAKPFSFWVKLSGYYILLKNNKNPN